MSVPASVAGADHAHRAFDADRREVAVIDV